MSVQIQASPRVRIKTNAKLNLFLRVMGRRGDGFHELESIFHGIGLADEITFVPTDSATVEIDMRAAEGLVGRMPDPRDNLIGAVTHELVRRGAIHNGLRVEIVKRVPMAAGLGGGSGNAAGAIVALSEMWGMELEKDALHEIAKVVGSDVPFCLDGGTALAMGRGDDVTTLPAPLEMNFVLGITNEELSTKLVYDTYDELEPGPDVGSAPITLALGSQDLEAIADSLHNDLERAAFSLRPGLESKKHLMKEAGALGAGMTGSGPTIFGIAEDASHAGVVAKEVEDHFDRVLVVSSISHCIERIE